MEFLTKYKKLGLAFWELGKIILISLLIVVPIRYFIVQPFVVRGSSMEPNFHNGDYLIVDEISYRFNNVKRGDVIVFKFSKTGDYLIKRVIGLPGERVKIFDNKITIINKKNPDGFILKEPYLESVFTPGDLKISLNNNEYFVLGDNRMFSYDSRQWGILKRKHIVGRVWLRIFPFNRAQAFVNPFGLSIEN